MFLRCVFFIYLGIILAQGDVVFACVWNNFAFTFTYRRESNVCSISKDNKPLLHYGNPITRVTIQQTSTGPAVTCYKFSLFCNVTPPIYAVNLSLNNTLTNVVNESFQLNGEFGEILKIQHVKESDTNARIMCFYLQPSGLRVADQQFLDSDAYNYTMFGLSIFNATCLVLLLLTIALRKATKVRGDSSNKYGVLPETLEADLVQEEKTTTELSTEKTKFDEGNSNIISKETNLQSPRPDDGPQQGISMYEDIVEDFKRLPKLPKKTSEMKKIRSKDMKATKTSDKQTGKKKDRCSGTKYEVLAETTESSAEKTKFDEDNSNIISKETNLQSPHPDDGPHQGISRYEDIVEDFKSIPKLPTKTSEMKKIRSEPVIHVPTKTSDKQTGKKRDRCKKPKDPPNEYCDLTRNTGGKPGLYEEMALDQPSEEQSKDPIQETYANTATVLRELGSKRL